MIRCVVLLVGGLLGAALASQFPEYAQQYRQRLGGAVDELALVVADFDASAAAEGLGRPEALARMRGTAFLERRRSDMTRALARHDRLRGDLAVLERAGPFMRVYHVVWSMDAGIARAALEDFQPAVPMTLSAPVFVVVGFVAGAAFAAMVWYVLAGVAGRLLWPPARGT